MPARRAQRGPNFAVLFGFLILAAASVGVAGWANSVKRRAAERETEESVPDPAEPRSDPFAGVPEDVPPSRRRELLERAEPRSGAPEDLALDPVWQKATELAREARLSLEAADEARAAGNASLEGERKSQARAAFDQALDSTARWEAKLLVRYGKDDPSVRDIVATRSFWLTERSSIGGPGDGDSGGGNDGQ